jgi:hypothetical protein
MDNDGSLGWGFWGSVFGVCLAIGVGGFLLFWFVGAAWYRWGFFGGLLVLGGVLLIVAWIYDRRATRVYDEGP